jgi:hypothetical protein
VTRLIAAILSLTLGLAAAFALVSCGSGDKSLLPGDTADEIESNLEEVQSRAAEGDCHGAQAAAIEVSQQVSDLGPEVSNRLREALAEGAARVQQTAVADCTPSVSVDSATLETDTDVPEAEPTEPDTEPTETTESDTEPTEPTTEPTTTSEPTTPTTTSEPTTPTAPPPPPSGDGGEGDGSGGIGPGGKAGLR